MNSKSASYPEHRVVLQIGLKSVGIICVLQIVLLLFLCWRPVASRSAANTKASGHSTRQDRAVAVGELPPWGELIVKDMDIQRPNEYLESDVKQDASTAWNFRGNLEQIRSLLVSCGFTESQLKSAFLPQSLEVTGSGVEIKPADDLLLSLSPETRGRLYAELARNPANFYMANPLHIKHDKIDCLVTEQGLPGATVSLFKKLLYPRGSLSFFSDLAFMFRHIPAEEDRLNLLKVATSEPSVMVRLKIHPDTDIDKLLGYWGGGSSARRLDDRPLFESIKCTPEGGSVSIAFLLPPFARDRLYTFPMPPHPGDAIHDCFWSALNYFNDTPDDRFGDLNYVGQYVKANYYQISKPVVHGDLVFICDAKDSALHAAIYLADDIVFTKNGMGYMEPWVLMRLPDLVNFYSTTGPAHTLAFRNKAL